MAQLTEWLKLMLAEINRKTEDSDRARAEDALRQKDAPSAPGGGAGGTRASDRSAA